MTSPASSLPPVTLHEDEDETALSTPAAAPETAPAKSRAPKRKPARRPAKKVADDHPMDTGKIGTPRTIDDTAGEDLENGHETVMEEASAPKPRYRSWRKKYRKLRLEFDRAVGEASALFTAEDKAWSIVERLKEEKDQLLDILHDLETENATAPPDQRRWEPIDLEELETSTTHAVAQDIERDLLPDDLVDLDDDDGHGGTAPGYFTTEEELAYTDWIDRIVAITGTKRRKRPLLTEKDFAERHPCSVHNWLRRNKPELFGGDVREIKDREKDKASERSGRSPPADGSGGTTGKKPLSKRAQKELDKAAGAAIKAEGGVDGLDEFGEPIDVPTGRQKRKRADDDSYRPKGGGSRSKKKKPAAADTKKAVLEEEVPIVEEEGQAAEEAA